ncbi:hypothetical protein BDQ12DRAFT_139245 [Crucibulum laeve]|uniref:F-box domain-containing protein n=1 Tax=Crucibulum laeve TaxID=68775 RepID=A0A5C3LY44_9AGAR|nr:hypothetical protein BDQ12DRAFT_139245 [Crucibulum laeve]
MNTSTSPGLSSPSSSSQSTDTVENTAGNATFLSLPPELHEHIVELSLFPSSQPSSPSSSATKNIIHALSLTSPYLHSISRPFLYASLSVRGVAQIARVLEKLESLKGRERIVRSLFISDASSPESLTSSGNHDSSPEVTKRLILRLLALAAPTLYTLEVRAGDARTSTSLFGHVFRISFPLLQELSVNGYYPFPNSPLAPIPSLFPSLTHLSLHGNRNPVGLLTLGSLLSFPSLQELKVGGLSAAGSFCIEVEGVLASYSYSSSEACSVIFEEEYEDSPEEEGQLLPTTLKRIVLQAAPAPIVRAGKQTTAQMKDRVMLERLRVLEGTRNGVEVVVLPREEV